MAVSSTSGEILLAAYHMAEDRKGKEQVHVSRNVNLLSIRHPFARHRHESLLKGPSPHYCIENLKLDTPV